MEVKDTYLSVESESRGSYREKASRFIALAFPVSSEAEVKEKLDSVRKEYYDANHHCYAYRLGPAGEKYRVNDDGEPSGTAGRPIYGQILSHGFSDLLVVVVRYFGGTKLGVPGLIHAYRTAAGEALSTAVPATRMLTDTVSVKFGYANMNDVMKALKDAGATIIRQDSGEDCTIRFSVRRSKSEETRNRLSKVPDIYISVNV